MTESEKIRLAIVVVLIIIVIARRMGFLEWVKDRKKKQAKAAAIQLRKEQKKDQRDEEIKRAEHKQQQTAQILKKDLVGLVQKKTTAAGQEMWYLESAAVPEAANLVLLHGFAADKECWTGMVRHLPLGKYRVLAPDLPGFGQNEKNPDKPYDVTTQAKRIRALIQKLGLERYHLVGHSVGGSIAAAIAYGAPQGVESLTLIEPFCVRVPYESELDKLLAQDRNPMVIATPAAYDNLLGFLYAQPPEIPAALKKLRAEQAAENRAFHLKVWQEVRSGERAYLLDLLLPEIRARTLVLQGAQSKIVHPATAEVIRSMMRGPRTQTIEDCGHVVMVERPQETARLLQQFLEPASTPSPTGTA